MDPKSLYQMNWLKNGPLAKYATIIKYGIVALVFLVLFIGGLAIYLRSAITAVPVVSNSWESGAISSSVTVHSSGALTYNLSKNVVEYSNFNYAFYNTTNANISLDVYNKNPEFKVYLLNTGNYCIRCPVESSLFSAMQSSFKQYGLMLNASSLNLVDINNIQTIPAGSVIVIASGLIPNILLENISYTERCPVYSNVTLTTLLNEGDTIVYVGKNFTNSVTCGGQTVQTNSQALTDIAPLTSYEQATDYMNGSLYFNSPTFFLSSGTVYRTASYVNYLNGTFISLSNDPGTGWNGNVGLLSQDLAKIISARFWMSTQAVGFDNLSFSSGYESSNLTLFTLNSTLDNVPGVGYTVNSTYPALQFALSNKNNHTRSIIPVEVNLTSSGQINLPEKIGQGQSTVISAQVFNATKVVIARMELYNSNLDYLPNSVVVFGQVGPSEVIQSPSFGLPSGYYIGKLVDQNGVVRAKSLFYLANATFVPEKVDFKNATFIFNVLSDGQPMTSGVYNISINGAYNQSGLISNGTLLFSLPAGTVIPYGTKTFSIGIFGDDYSLSYPYTSTGIVIPPLYIEFGIAAVFIVVLNRVLVPPNIDDYFIDVPDIRPMQKQPVKETSDAIIDVFDKVNTFYHWKYLPLTVEEVRSGISTNVKYGNTKIAITLNNAYSVLNTLISRGLIEEAGEYYVPKRWVEASGYSAEYLVIYRKLRDFCIANSILFTELGTTDKADMIITNKGVQSYIKIYPGNVKIKDIEISAKLMTVIVFLNEDKRLTFMERLYDAYGPNAEVLKMAVEYGNVKLIDTSNLDELRL